MPFYHYKARTLEGRLIKGKIEACDINAVRNFLRDMDCYAEKIMVRDYVLNYDYSHYFSISLKSIALFCRQFAFILNSGIQILRAIDLMIDQTEDKKFLKILHSVSCELRKGNSLSVALSGNNEIPEMLVSMIEVGELSGTLDRVMMKMAEYYDKSFRLKKKVNSSMIYPIMVCITAIVVINILVIFVVPNIINMITSVGGTIPLPTRIVMKVSFLLRRFGLLLIVAAVLGFIWIKNLASKYHELSMGIDSLKLKTPIFGKVTIIIASARFARTFATLTSSGLPIMETIDTCARTAGNSVISRGLNICNEEINKGAGIGESLERMKVFPPVLIQMIKIGEETGTMDTLMEKTAEFYEYEVDTITQQLSNLLEPVIMIVLAIIVGFIVIAMLLPMLGMYDAVANM